MTRTLQNRTGLQYRARTDGDPGININRIGIQNPHASALMLPDNPLPEQRLQLCNGIRSENRQPAGHQLRSRDLIGHPLFPALLQLIARRRIGKTRTGLRRRQCRPAQNQHRVRRVQECHQILLPLRNRDICLLRQACPGFRGETGTADDKKTLHTIGQQLLARPGEDRAKNNGFQHQRFGMFRNGGVLFQKEHGPLGTIHDTFLLY